MKRGTSMAITVVMVLACTMLSGCGTPPYKTVAGFLDEVKALNAEEMNEQVVSADGDVYVTPFEGANRTTDEWLQSTMDRVTYKVHRPASSKGSATVAVTITCVDLLR